MNSKLAAKPACPCPFSEYSYLESHSTRSLGQIVLIAFTCLRESQWFWEERGSWFGFFVYFVLVTFVSMSGFACMDVYAPHV